MSLLRKFKAITPCVEDNIVPRFQQSTLEDVIQEVKDAKGNIISTRKVKTPIVKEIPDEDFENRGITVDMFSVEALSSVGKNLFMQKPITTPFIKPTLEERSEASDYIEGFDYEQLSEGNSNVQSNNNVE